MTEKQAIRRAMWSRRWSQAKVAEKLGMKHQSNVSEMLKEGRSVRFETFLKLMTAMDFEITITNMRNPDEQYVVNGEYEDVYDEDD